MKKLVKFANSSHVKAFFRFPVNSFLSFFIRFFSLYFFVDLMKFNYIAIYLSTYLYVIFQSYLIQKYYVQKSTDNKLFKFFTTNLFLGLIEALLIYILENLLNYYYSYMLIISAIFMYFLRYYLYTFKIFTK